MFNPQHLEGVSTKLVQSMFKIGRKATELECQKLQAEIRKEESAIRSKKLEKHIQMASNKGKKGGAMKNLKTELHNDDDDFLDIITNKLQLEVTKNNRYQRNKMEK